MYAEVFLTFALTEMILAAWTRLDRWPRSLKRTIAKTGVWGACCYFLVFSGCAVEAVLGKTRSPDKLEEPSLVAIAGYLASTQAYAGRQRVLADVFWGGEILYRTGHEVIGTPYHRNTRGILDTHRIFRSQSEDEAFEMIRNRAIDLIVVYPSSQKTRRYYGGEQGTPTFYERLCESKAPSWCREVALPADLNAFRLFEVRHD
jgi:hypothetical protein